MVREKTCCFTGHRPSKLPWGNNERDPRCVELKTRLNVAVAEAYESGIRHFISGMALGADFYFCDAVLAFKKTHPDVTLEAAIPCEEQAAAWAESDRARYFDLVARCDYETMIQRHYDSGCMKRRNRYMVGRSSMIIAVYDGLLGGTMYTLNQAMNEGLTIKILDLNEIA